MALSSSDSVLRPGAPTPGPLPLATAEDLRVAQWNMGLATERHFSKHGKIHAALLNAAARIRLMAEYVHVVALNELCSAFHEELDKILSEPSPTAPKLQMVAMESGDALVWCHAARSTNRCGGCCMW